MAEPTKNLFQGKDCRTSPASQEAEILDAARRYAQSVCGTKVVDSFTAVVSEPEETIIEDIAYYCRQVNASFFCEAPQPVKGSNPTWEKGSPKREHKPRVKGKDYL